MPSSPSTRIRAELQAAGENLNTWGNPKLNSALSRLEEAICGRYGGTVSGAVSLTSVNYSADQARMAFLDITGGTGGTITAPAVEKTYIVRNNASGAVIITTGSGLTATVQPGDIAWVVGDATNFYKVQSNDFGGSKIVNLGSPTNAADAVTKAYADALAMAALSGSLPAQTGNAGKFLGTNGAVASWSVASVVWVACSSNITLAVTTAYSVDTSAARALALPSATGLDGTMSIRVADTKGLAATNPITVSPNGTQTINGVASDTLVIDVAWGDVVFIPVTGGWVSVLD